MQCFLNTKATWASLWLRGNELVASAGPHFYFHELNQKELNQ